MKLNILILTSVIMIASSMQAMEEKEKQQVRQRGTNGAFKFSGLDPQNRTKILPHEEKDGFMVTCAKAIGICCCCPCAGVLYSVESCCSKLNNLR